MSKKERNKEVVTAEFAETVIPDEPIYEAEAYDSPLTEINSDGTVMKQVGVGGPVPIAAPKYNTIQLQPIVVPLAVVPYMTQDSNILRTDGRPQGGYVASQEDYAEATQFQNMTQQNTKKKEKKDRKSQLPRIFALISLLFTVFIVLLFTLADQVEEIGSLYIKNLDFIGIIKGWAANPNSIEITGPEQIVYIAAPMFTAVLVITSLIGLIINKYPRLTTSIISCITVICLLVPIAWNLIKGQFLIYEQVSLLVALIVDIVSFALAVIFSIILNHKDDVYDERSRYGREI